jgi:hypothetical protein
MGIGGDEALGQREIARGVNPDTTVYASRAREVVTDC